MSIVKITAWDSPYAAENGREFELSWERFCDWFRKPDEFTGKNHRGWSAASFTDGHRCIESVSLAYALVLDFDETVISDVVKALLLGLRYVAHSSKSNTAATPRYRAAIALSRPVTASEYYRVWRAFTEPSRGTADEACKDPSRFWYWPTRKPETLWEDWSSDGKPIDVEVLIDEAIKLEEREQKIRSELGNHVQLRPESRASNVVKRAERYIAQMPAAISGSHGHDATWAVACTLVKGFSLDRATAVALMVNDYNPRCVPPWRVKDLERKIDQAINKCRELSDGYLLGDRDGWSDDHASRIPPTPRVEAEQEQEPPGWMDDPDGVAVSDGVVDAEPAQVTESVQTAAQRYDAWSTQRLALEVLTDVNRKQEQGCPTGVAAIDLAMGGMRPKHITILGMDTSVGKTTFSVMAADETCKRKKRPMILTFEDAPLMYGRRLVSRRGRINFCSLRDRDVSYQERKEIIRVAGQATSEPFLVDCIGKSAEYAAHAITEMCSENQIDLVIVDYLQRIKTERRFDNRKNEVTHVMTVLSDAIKTSGAAGLILSQLKRRDSNTKPVNEDLKESGDIECFAEHILLGWREIHQDGTEERFIYLSKNKDGEPLFDPIKLDWDRASACFNSSVPEYDDLDDINQGITG